LIDRGDRGGGLEGGGEGGERGGGWGGRRGKIMGGGIMGLMMMIRGVLDLLIIILEVE